MVSTRAAIRWSIKSFLLMWASSWAKMASISSVERALIIAIGKKTKKYMYLKYAKLKKLNDRNCCNYKLRFFKNFIKTSRVKLKLM